MAWHAFNAEFADARTLTLWFWALFALHWLVFGHDAIVKARRWVHDSYASFKHSDPQPRLDEAMRRQTEKNFELQSGIMHHGALVSIPVLWHLPGARTMLFLSVIAYVIHGSVSCHLLAMTASRSRVVWLWVYGMLALSMWETSAMQGPEGNVIQSLYTVTRMLMTMIQIDSGVHIPGQLVLSVVEVLGSLAVHGPSCQVLQLSCFQAFLATGCIAMSLHQEGFMRESFAAKFKSEDAEAMVLGFRRMLQGLCDGSVLLNGQLNIQDHSPCLSQMLSASADFKGTAFPKLLADTPGEHARFKEFISACPLRPEALGPPPCIRVSLSRKGQNVGVDLFHVSLPHLYGSDECYHLLALRQDTEQQVPEATDLQQQLLMREALSRCSAASVRTASSVTSAGPLLHTLPQLTEMMLLVEATQRHQDVCQVHLNYEAAGVGDLNMPSLRKFIRPTDWESVRSRVRRFSARAAEEPAVEPKYFSKPVWFRMLDAPSKFMQAHKAKLCVHRAPGHAEGVKVWLYLTDFAVPEQLPPPLQLAGIRE